MTTDTVRDVMQVCLRGHVITDVFASYPELGAAHCDRCGAPTLSRCPTCGEEIPGAASLPGMTTIGERAAPQFCPLCGASFPWTTMAIAAPAGDTLAILEPLLRRLPRAARQLRDRRPGSPSLRVADVLDLEDLLRAALHLQFDAVRRETRTPSYAPATRTDYIVGREPVAVIVKLVSAGVSKRQLVAEIEEDAVYYQCRPGFERIAVLLYDPGQTLQDPQRFEAAWAQRTDAIAVCCIVAS